MLKQVPGNTKLAICCNQEQEGKDENTGTVKSLPDTVQAKINSNIYTLLLLFVCLFWGKAHQSYKSYFEKLLLLYVICYFMLNDWVGIRGGYCDGNTAKENKYINCLTYVHN